MPEPHISGRALAAALGVTEGAVRTALKSGRIKRESDGRFDLQFCRSEWARTTEPSRSKVRKTLRTKLRTPTPNQATQSEVRTEPAELAQVLTADMLWTVMAELPSLAAWHSVAAGCPLQQCFDASANLALDIGGTVKTYFGLDLPGSFDPVDWPALSEEYGLTPIDPAAMRADWQARRDAP